MVRNQSVVFLALSFLAARPLPEPVPAVGLRCVVLESDVTSATWKTVATLGANLVARTAPPDADADRAARDAGVSYLAFLSTAEIENIGRDPQRLQELRAETNLAGFFYWDLSVVEGFTTPDVQQRAYTTLKSLFPEKIVLYPTRLDPIAWSPGFLDSYFRPEFTDLVTPYFYPVGTTFIGEAREQDDWRSRLAALLVELAPRVPSNKAILPVLQGYEQQGYPLSARFPAEQLEVYRRFWPGLANAAIEAWEFPPGPLVPLVARPALREGVCVLFARLAGPPERCRFRPVVTWR